MKQRSLCCTDVRSETCDTIEPLFMYSSTGYTLFTRHTDYVSLCIVTLQLLSVTAVYFQLVIVSSTSFFNVLYTQSMSEPAEKVGFEYNGSCPISQFGIHGSCRVARLRVSYTVKNYNYDANKGTP